MWYKLISKQEAKNTSLEPKETSLKKRFREFFFYPPAIPSAAKQIEPSLNKNTAAPENKDPDNLFASIEKNLQAIKKFTDGLNATSQFITEQDATSKQIMEPFIEGMNKYLPAWREKNLKNLQVITKNTESIMGVSKELDEIMTIIFRTNEFILPWVVKQNKKTNKFELALIEKETQAPDPEYGKFKLEICAYLRLSLNAKEKAIAEKFYERFILEHPDTGASPNYDRFVKTYAYYEKFKKLLKKLGLLKLLEEK